MRRWLPWISAALIVALLGWLGIDRWLGRMLAPVTTPLADAWSGSGSDPVVAGLREQVARLSAENASLRQRIDDDHQFATQRGPDLAASQVSWAQVAGRPLRAGRRYLELDSGAVDGLAAGMAACLGWSLVGRVVGLIEGRALVQCVIDAEFRLPVRIVAGGGRFADGVWAGTGSRDRAEIRWVEGEDLTLAPGAAVIAAGGEGVPAGILLGTVVTVSRPDRARGNGHWVVTAAPLRDGLSADSLMLLKEPARR